MVYSIPQCPSPAYRTLFLFHCLWYYLLLCGCGRTLSGCFYDDCIFNTCCLLRLNLWRPLSCNSYRSLFCCIIHCQRTHQIMWWRFYPVCICRRYHNIGFISWMICCKHGFLGFGIGFLIIRVLCLTMNCLLSLINYQFVENNNL